jgi:hypothetical protein
VPFIARYHKEATGSLDDVAVSNMRERLVALTDLDQLSNDRIDSTPIASLQQRQVFPYRMVCWSKAFNRRPHFSMPFQWSPVHARLFAGLFD